MSRKAYVRNLEPAWVEWLVEVEVPDELDEDESAAYAEREAMQGRLQTVASGPRVIDRILGLDQTYEFDSFEAA